MIQKKPGDRFQTPIQVFDALAPFVPDDVPLPDPAWFPEPAIRVALSRPAMASSNVPRAGTTSQILAAAMRSTGSGSTPNSSSQRRQETSSGGSTSDGDKLLVISPELMASQSGATTDDMRMGETQRTPEPGPLPHPVHPQFNPTLIISSLAMALMMALLGILILLLRG
jgi:hypothetical protein